MRSEYNFSSGDQFKITQAHTFGIFVANQCSCFFKLIPISQFKNLSDGQSVIITMSSEFLLSNRASFSFSPFYNKRMFELRNKTIAIDAEQFVHNLYLNESLVICKQKQQTFMELFERNHGAVLCCSNDLMNPSLT